MSVRASTIAIGMIGLAEALAVPASAQLQGQTIRIAIGAPLTGGAATFGVEMKQAVELALAEQNAGGGLLGGRVEARVADDEANDAKGLAVARGLCEDPGILGGVGHVDSNVSIRASTAYQAG